MDVFEKKLFKYGIEIVIEANLRQISDYLYVTISCSAYYT